MTDSDRAEKTLGFLKTYPTTIVIDKREIPAAEVTAIYAQGVGLTDAGLAGREEAKQRLAAALAIDAAAIDDAGLDSFLAFIDDKWAYPPPPAIPPGKIRWIELEGFGTADNPIGIHPDCAEIFAVANEPEGVETGDGDGNGEAPDGGEVES